MLRAIALPVVEPLSGGWADFRGALAEMWRLMTQASNWLMTELYARDVRRKEQEQKIPPMPRAYLYPDVRQLFPALPPKSIVALEQAIQHTYRAKRYEIVWTRSAALPTVRYPCPFRIHNQAWKLWFDAGNRPIVSVQLGVKWWELRLRGGPRYGRQLDGFRRMAEGSAKRGELSLFRHHDGEIICKMVAWLPRLPAIALEGVLSVRSSNDALLVAVDTKGDRLWTYNADHVRRWSAEHVRLVQRLAEDQKAETRPQPAFAARRAAAARKYRDRMASATHEITASLANFAARRKYAVLRYDDSNRGFCQQFPWFELREKLRYKLDAFGIALEHESGTSVSPSVLPLAEENKNKS